MFSVSSKGSIADKSTSTPTQQRVTAVGEAKVSGSEAKKSPKKKARGLPPDSPWRGPGRYSFAIEGGGGGENFHNGKGIDHKGGYVGASFGLILDLGKNKRHLLNPYLALRHQWLRKDSGQGVESKAGALHFAAGLGYRYRVHPKWFSIGPEFEIGAGRYKAADPILDLETGITQGGAEFNKNASLLPLQKSGFHVAGGIKMCTVGQTLCAGVRMFADVGVNPKYEFVDPPEGGNPPVGFSPRGVQGGVSFDFVQLVHFIRENKKAKAVKKAGNADPAKPAPGSAKSAGTPAAATAAVPPTATMKQAGLSVTEWVATTAAGVQQAENAAQQNARHLSDIRLEAKKQQPDPAMLRFHAKDAMDRNAEATQAAQQSRKAQLALEKKVGETSGETRNETQRAWKTTQENTEKIDRAAAKAYLDGKKVYDLYFTHAGDGADLAWTQEVPPGGLDKAAPAAPRKAKQASGPKSPPKTPEPAPTKEPKEKDGPFKWGKK